MLHKLISLILIVGLLSCTKQSHIAIVENGTTEYEIILPDNSDKIVEKAASELQFYLEKISSVTVPIVEHNNTNTHVKYIFVGRKEDNLKSPHSILIKNEGENIVITGGSSQSVLYAVYEFLETQTGCRWYSPTVEKIPDSKNISIQTPLNYSYTPEIVTRTVHSRL